MKTFRALDHENRPALWRECSLAEWDRAGDFSREILIVNGRTVFVVRA